MKTVNSSGAERVVETAIRTNVLGLNQGMSGNISLRDGEGFLITPSAVAHEALTPEDIVPVTFSGEWPGYKKPSSEWRFHADIYQRHADAGAVIHAHPPWCTTLACLHREIPAFHYMVAVAGGDSIRCADYALFGTPALSDNILRALEGRKACLIANHGMVCFDEDLESALALAMEVENLARLYAQALSIGEPALLDHKQMAEVMERFSRYRDS